MREEDEVGAEEEAPRPVERKDPSAALPSPFIPIPLPWVSARSLTLSSSIASCPLEQKKITGNKGMIGGNEEK